MKAIDHTMKSVVPEYGHIKRAMPSVTQGRQREKKTQGSRKKKEYLLTERSQNENKAVLRKGVTVNQAARKLNAYEATGLTPQEVLNLMERERNLTRRVEKLEGWE